MLEDLQIRNYSPTTTRIYLHVIAEFARHFGKPPDQLGGEHIRRYQLFLIKEKQVSLSTCIQTVCALRFFYTQTLKRKILVATATSVPQRSPSLHRRPPIPSSTGRIPCPV